jgi:hypothetical protein
VDEDQRRDLLRGAEDEVRRVSREHGRDSPQARAERQRQLGLERSTAAELGLPYAQRVDLEVRWDAGTPMPVVRGHEKVALAQITGSGANSVNELTDVGSH